MNPHPVYPHVSIRGRVDYDRLEYLRQRARREEAQAGPTIRPRESRTYIELDTRRKDQPRRVTKPSKMIYSDRPGEGPWRSLDEAAVALGRDRSTIHHAVKWGTKCAGRRLSYAPFRAMDAAA